MKTLVNIQLSSNNRDNHLFRFFLSSLNQIQSLNDICNISINYNGKITAQEIELANSKIKKLGFKLFTQYSSYDFPPSRVQMARLREDANFYKDSSFSLLVDDDLEFKSGYSKALLGAINYLQKYQQVGEVILKDIFFNAPLDKNNSIRSNIGSKNVDFNNYICFPATPRETLSCYGGILIRQQNNLYSKELLTLHGGGEEQLLGILTLVKGQQVAFCSTDAYAHEHHWTNGSAVCGQGQYQWSWRSKDPTTFMSQIVKYESQPWLHDKAWTGEPYWEDPNNYWDFSQYTEQNLKEGIKYE